MKRLKLWWECLKWGHIYELSFRPVSPRPDEDREHAFNTCKHCGRSSYLWTRMIYKTPDLSWRNGKRLLP